MLNRTICILFTKANTFCKFLLIGCDRIFKRNDTLQRHNCGAKDQRKLDNYFRKCFQWTKDGHNLRNHTGGVMCEDRRNFISAQTDPVYSDIKRYITGTHSFELFSDKIPFNNGLGERIQEGVAKIRAERRSESMLQQTSAECGPKLCLKRFDQVAIRTEPPEAEPANDHQSCVPGPLGVVMVQLC